MCKNYRPIFLLPICSKMFERLIYNELFPFSTVNKMNFPNQSGFRPGDSSYLLLLLKYIGRLMTSERVFFDISKAFDKVWHEGLLLKL